MTAHSVNNKRDKRPTEERSWVRIPLIAMALGFLLLFLVLPIIAIFMKAFEKGVGVYLASITDPDATSAIKLTLLVAVLTVPLNALFGIAAAWAKIGRAHV